MTNMERDESVMKFARQLRGMGVDEALRDAELKTETLSESETSNSNLWIKIRYKSVKRASKKGF